LCVGLADLKGFAELRGREGNGFLQTKNNSDTFSDQGLGVYLDDIFRGNGVLVLVNAISNAPYGTSNNAQFTISHKYHHMLTWNAFSRLPLN
jgi:hypothetical protein